MANEQSNSDYHHGSKNELEQNFQKREENQTAPIIATADEVESKTFTNIYYDCLERIFEFLDSESLLLNVAGTCKRLQIAAAAKFGDYYGHTRIYLRKPYSDEEPFSLSEFILGRNWPIRPIIGLKFNFPFLRCFGSKILDLSIDYRDFTDTQCNHLDRYIGQYCADTLTSISFQSKHLFSDEVIPRPFKSIESVHIYDSKLGNQLPNFVNWFPNLHKLSMMGIRNYDETAMAVYFPRLKHLSFGIKNLQYDLPKEIAIKLLQANRQLKCLYISSYPSSTLAEVLELIKENPFLSKLTMSRIRNINTDELNQFISEHQSIEELELSWGLFEVDKALLLIRQIKSLKRFEFELKNHSEWDGLLNQLDGKWQHSAIIGNGSVYVKLIC